MKLTTGLNPYGLTYYLGIQAMGTPRANPNGAGLEGFIKLTEELGEPKWIQMSERIATIMRERKNLNANVDFYSATVYYSLGIPTDLFTPIFAIARSAGWTAQVLEQLRDNRLYRPLTLYTGPSELKEVEPIAERG